MTMLTIGSKYIQNYTKKYNRVNRCYNIAFGRNVDNDGFNYFKYSDEPTILRHLIQSSEFKIHSNINFDIYSDFNKDLQKMSREELIEHFVSHGYKEDRIYNTTSFNVSKLKSYYNTKNAFNYMKKHSLSYPFLNTEKYIQDCIESREEVTSDISKYFIKTFLLISHDTTGGAPKVLLQIKKYLENTFGLKCYILFPKYSQTCHTTNCIYYHNDPFLLLNIINTINPYHIIVNSWNCSFNILKSIITKYKFSFYSHEFRCHYDSNLLDENIKLYCVGEIIKKEYDLNLCEVKICHPFYLNWDKIDRLAHEDSELLDKYISVLKNKIVIGGSGAVHDSRKNFSLFQKVCEMFEQSEQFIFMWIGGDKKTYNNNNLITIEHTQNPFKFMKHFDYYLQLSTLEPCAYVNVECLYLGVSIINFTKNIGHIHDSIPDDKVINSNETMNLKNVCNVVNNNCVSKKTLDFTESRKYVKKFFSKPAMNFEI